MVQSDSAAPKLTIKNSRLYSLCSNAFSLVQSGREKTAKEEFPMEYHFIKKYLPESIEELTNILTKKLELH